MIVYAATIFIGACLVFAVQPLLGKVLLPWFGGGTSIWTVCLLFFQSVLLLGYLWAHALDRWLIPRRQAQLQLAAVLVSLGLLAGLAWSWPAPIIPGPDWQPTADSRPVWRILLILSVGVGLPSLLLCAASPLLQAWFRDLAPQRRPWTLYALSNAGSLLGLLAYPFLVEPRLDTVAQGRLWSGLYLLFAGGVAACAWPLLRGRLTAVAVAAEPEAVAPRPGPVRRLLWLALAATGTVLLLAGTNQMCQEVAVIPFLWVLPLSLYLLTMVLAFSSERGYGRAWAAPLFVLAAAGAVAALYLEYELDIVWQVVAYAAVVFAGCLLCHGELVRLKPHPRHLTGFYLTMAAGGALGGAAVALLAPLVFDGYWELHLALFGCGALHLLALAADGGSWLHGRRRWLRASGPALVLLGLGGALTAHPVLFAEDVVWSQRNFYGVLRVRLTHPGVEQFHAHDLIDGHILHGYQLQAPLLRRRPTCYYAPSSGLGLALQYHPRRLAGLPLRVGLVGLGIGTAAAYGRPGDRLRFYEINPAVIRLASGAGGYFSYLQDSPARIEIVPGDARISLERELARGDAQGFDLLAVDAFQSDAIPVHLLTREALAVYLEHLAPDGLLLLHVTNLNLNLEPVVDRLASEFDLVVAVVRDQGDGWIALRSHWMLLTREPMILAHPEIAARSALPAELPEPAPLWTDRHTSLLPLLR
jgi:hypothetical protein